MIEYLSAFLNAYLTENLLELGLTTGMVESLVRGGLILLVLLLSWVAHRVSQGPINRSIEKFAHYTIQQWDDILVEKHIVKRILYFIPLILLYVLSSPILTGTSLLPLSQTLISVLFLIAGMMFLDAILSALLAIYGKSAIAKEISIIPFVQVLKLGLYFVTGILLLSLLLQKTPLYFLSGLGALTAVLMFVFKDVLMGFVAGIQLIANKMVAPKDWIEMPKYGADGDVIEITLTTVKVQNFDNTITTIPTYALINESFKNWRNMNLSGGRRIKRYVNIDLGSIKFCSSEMLERFKRIQLISQYIQNRQEEILVYNKKHQVDESTLVNGRRLTNIGVFRSYVEAYLRQHPMIHKDMTFLIRQLSPSENGLPIEIYVFCKDTNWTAYEAIQADIFDHILAVVPEFDLRVFQEPSGSDFQKIAL
ncbi:MAG TPA: mechanosensitive ion channel protein MscS [Deltaproteobacteria bacterium]|jgi:miniconductance mechanosensitive channel|uniref:Mechanosensing system component YbdG n=1 Tax=SAR324 cluster bacterium TaxID=2024889 RepID=A0A432GBQ1_9DELT|nr:mechanosensitive ion channel [SAR324 cluster bacterium]HBJ46830.1 mechanosensitive ion channel protein MscS [Deltaproteobacteria bacterium]HIB39589.1 mechanosensitive ion channel [Candidatus Lambdaproteobacteria bacterium]RTZ79261.1 MAG: mechanosensitive ion channel family protein [SAR324 cluster bacterium]RTZ80945.1 MAG: mechanosensitive ion channel family protein [SAR324 cluster bacterium]